MRFLLLIQVLMIAGTGFMLPFILGQDDDIVREAKEVIDALQKGQEIDTDRRQEDPCEDDCDPDETCDCDSDGCIPQKCLVSHTIDRGNDKFAEAPRKKNFGFIRRTARKDRYLLCRNALCKGTGKKYGAQAFEVLPV